MQEKTEGYVEEWILEVLAQREKYIIYIGLNFLIGSLTRFGVKYFGLSSWQCF